jgi:hypothetical protein
MYFKKEAVQFPLFRLPTLNDTLPRADSKQMQATHTAYNQFATRVRNSDSQCTAPPLERAINLPLYPPYIYIENVLFS